MKKLLSSLALLCLVVTAGYSYEFAVSTAEASREAHSEFINTYRTKIESKASRKGIPFAVVAAVMSSQSGAEKQASNYNFSLITTNSKYARVGKFLYADEQHGLMVFERPRHNAEATVLVLQGWAKSKMGVYPSNDLEWLQALTDVENGLLPPERLTELAVAYEAATGTYLDMAQLNPTSIITETPLEYDLAIQMSQKEQELYEMNQALADAKNQLAQKEQKIVVTEQEKEVIREALVTAREELTTAEVEADSARNKVVNLRNEFQSHKANPNPLFKSMIDIRGGIGFFKQEGLEELSNALNLELQYSRLIKKGLGFEVGVNLLQESEAEEFMPFINPYLGVSFGKYDNTIGFSIAPRAYYFMNPMSELETIVEGTTMINRVKPTFMYGAGANVKLKIGDIGAFTIYSNYMRGPYKVETTGTLNDTSYSNTTQTNLNIFGGGIGLSFNL